MCFRMAQKYGGDGGGAAGGGGGEFDWADRDGAPLPGEEGWGPRRRAEHRLELLQVWKRSPHLPSSPPNASLPPPHTALPSLPGRAVPQHPPAPSPHVQRASEMLDLDAHPLICSIVQLQLAQYAEI